MFGTHPAISSEISVQWKHAMPCHATLGLCTVFRFIPSPLSFVSIEGMRIYMSSRVGGNYRSFIKFNMQHVLRSELLIVIMATTWVKNADAGRVIMYE